MPNPKKPAPTEEHKPPRDTHDDPSPNPNGSEPANSDREEIKKVRPNQKK